MSVWMKDRELFLLLAMVLGIGTSDTHAQLGKVVIEAEDLADRRFVTVEQVEGASGGRVVHFNDKRGFVTGQVQLQSGLYRLRVRGVGMGFDMDSARMTFDGRKLRAVVPVNRWGGTGYEIHVPRKGVYRVEIAFGEPHVIIDRLSFTRTSAEAPTDLKITPLLLRKGAEARIPWEKIVLGVAAADAEGPTTVVEVENLNDKQFVEIQEIEGASGGKAVLFADAMGCASGQIQLKRGRYLARIRGVGRDLDADAADMRFAGKKFRVVVPVNRWGGNGYAGHWAKPWWITETGASDVNYQMGGGTPEKQAQQVVKRYCLGFAKGAEKILWYRPLDPEDGRGGSPNEALFGGNGLFDAEGNIKLGGKAYRLLAEKIDFFSSVDVLSMEKDRQVAVQPGQGVVMLKFGFTFKDPVYVAWSDDCRTYALAVPKRWEMRFTKAGMTQARPNRAKITDIYGKEKAEDISTDHLHLELTETAIYLEFFYPFSRRP